MAHTRCWRFLPRLQLRPYTGRCPTPGNTRYETRSLTQRVSNDTFLTGPKEPVPSFLLHHQLRVVRTSLHCQPDITTTSKTSSTDSRVPPTGTKQLSRRADENQTPRRSFQLSSAPAARHTTELGYFQSH